MIQTQDILIAGKGKLLYYPAENTVWRGGGGSYQICNLQWSSVDGGRFFGNRRNRCCQDRWYGLCVLQLGVCDKDQLYIRCSDRIDVKLLGVSRSVSGKVQRDAGVEEIRKRGGKALHREQGGMTWT